ncbi:IclR family transcriptional regulator [Nocardia blacklockiae]|uniref:IclR family transcriptional regulator n=1 Tax=Nocardia blacklockiae TaxID=480036 RepID=UPI002B4B10A1|nr:helix-turn-helix domain-containing protein [Nocardia blacklockiae]
MTRAEPNDGAQTLERGLAVLVELGRHPEGLTTAQVAAACGLHRSITTRLLVSLQRTGFAQRDEGGAYRVGPAVGELLGLSRPGLREVAAPVLERLARAVDATASLVEVIDGYAVTTLVAEPPSDGPRFSYRLGNRDPLDRGAGGVAALASGPPRAGEPDRVGAARADGFVTTHGELNQGAHAIAAPLPGWGRLAAVNIVTNRESVVDAARDPLLDAVRDIGAHAADSLPDAAPAVR